MNTNLILRQNSRGYGKNHKSTLDILKTEATEFRKILQVKKKKLFRYADYIRRIKANVTNKCLK